MTTKLLEKWPLGASASYADAVRRYFEQHLKQFVAKPREELEQMMRDGLKNLGLGEAVITQRQRTPEEEAAERLAGTFDQDKQIYDVSFQAPQTVDFVEMTFTIDEGEKR